MKKTYVKDVPQLRQYLLDAYEEIKPNSITRRMIKKLYDDININSKLSYLIGTLMEFDDTCLMFN